MALPGDDVLHRMAASCVCFGFPGLEVDDHAREMMALGCKAVILFTRNIESQDQVEALCASLKRAAHPRKLLVCVDQEGGRVARLHKSLGFSDVPAARTVGATEDPGMAKRAGEILGRELAAMHVDMNFAPVLDVDTNPDNPVIADRSFSRKPEVVGRLGLAMARAMQAEGVAACGKHFPGHGDTGVDSHLALPSVAHGKDRLETVELPPFKHAIDGGIASIMTAHVVVQALDPRVPATMAPGVINGLLRDGLGFDGPVVSDCMEMGAIQDHFGTGEAVVASLRAGVDLFLVCHTREKQLEAMDAIVAAVKGGKLPLAALETAVRRVDELVEKWAKPAPTKLTKLTLVGSKKHRDAIKEILKRAGGSDLVDASKTQKLGETPYAKGKT